MTARLQRLTMILVLLACRGDPDAAREQLPDTIAPIGTGTELLLTRERLAMMDEWVRASIERNGKAPASVDELHPPTSERSRFAPLDRYLRDGWGRAIEYEYSPDARSYELRSVGADGTPRTADDITLRGAP